MTGMRNALKVLGALIAVIALCAPLMFLPDEDTESASAGLAYVTVTVPPTVVVATTIPGLETTTTTTEVHTQPSESTTTTQPTTTTTGPTDIVIAAVGGVLTPPAILDSVRDARTGSYDLGPIFDPVAPYLSKADYTVAALGPRLAGPAVGYSSTSASNAPRELAFALKAAGVDLVGTANPQALDLGWDGLTGTLDRLDAAGLAHVGTYRTSAERARPFIADVKGVRVAFLDYTSSLDHQLSATEQKEFAVNTVSFDAVRADAGLARTWGADAVVVMIDYGSTGADVPDPKQTALADQILQYAGVDVVLGCDATHILPIQPLYDIYSSRRKYVGYSLGDMLTLPQDPTDAKAAAEPYGMVVYLHFQKNGLSTTATGVSYLPLYLQKSTASGTAPTSTTASMATSASTGTTSGKGSPVTTGTTAAPGGAGPGGDSTTTRSTPTTLAADTVKSLITTFRILPVLLGVDPESDVPISADDEQRMRQIWEYCRDQLYRPDESIRPLVPGDLGLPWGS